MPAKQSATNGHVTLLKQKMLTAILRRVDSVLFEKLTAGIPAVLLYAVKSQMRLSGALSMQITSLHRNNLDVVTPVLLEELMTSCKCGLDVQQNAAEPFRSVKLSQIWAQKLPAEPKSTRECVSPSQNYLLNCRNLSLDML